jgi:hypothetical protein
VFAGISLSQPHILLLDEPTNHLDMQSIDALCDAVEEFGGGVVVISHDAQLLSRLCADEERSQVGARVGGGGAPRTGGQGPEAWVAARRAQVGGRPRRGRRRSRANARRRPPAPAGVDRGQR